METGYRSRDRKGGVRHQPKERTRERTRDRDTKRTNQSKWSVIMAVKCNLFHNFHKFSCTARLKNLNILGMVNIKLSILLMLVSNLPMNIMCKCLYSQ